MSHMIYTKFPLRSQGKFFAQKFICFLFGIIFVVNFYVKYFCDFSTKIPRIFFIKNSLLTFFYKNIFHFLLKSFYHYFSILTLYRGSFFRGQLHCCAGAFLPRSGRPFCQHNLNFW